MHLIFFLKHQPNLCEKKKTKKKLRKVFGHAYYRVLKSGGRCLGTKEGGVR